MFDALRDWFERRRALREARAGERHGNQAYSRYFMEQINFAKHEFDEGNPKRALEIWRRMYGQFPDLCLTSEKAFNLFIDLGCHDEAESLTREGSKRYPRHRALFAAYFARIAYRRGDLEEAVSRCAALRRKFPHLAEGFTIAANSLSDLGRLEDADAMLARGVSKLSGEVDLYVRHARHAMRMRKFPEALQRWNLVCKSIRLCRRSTGARPNV